MRIFGFDRPYEVFALDSLTDDSSRPLMSRMRGTSSSATTAQSSTQQFEADVSC
jgi:hypothetical protein